MGWMMERTVSDRVQGSDSLVASHQARRRDTALGRYLMFASPSVWRACRGGSRQGSELIRQQGELEALRLHL